jgi:hypothetical protein
MDGMLQCQQLAAAQPEPLSFRGIAIADVVKPRRDQGLRMKSAC